jgi:hypothetical protein
MRAFSVSAAVPACGPAAVPPPSIVDALFRF